MRAHRLIPPFIEQQARADKSAGSLTGVVLFVDVSGFSTLTDELMGHGRYGAEVLAKVVRTVFEPTMCAVYEQGGFIFSQEGDSFTALFVDEENLWQGARRALAAALRIQAAVAAGGRQFTEFGEFILQVRIGLSAGQVSWAIAASSDARRAAFYFYGPPLDVSAEAQMRAPVNGIVFDTAFQDLIGAEVAAEAMEGFYGLRQALGDLPQPIPVHLPELDLDVAARFYPRELFTAAVQDEFRPVVSLFVSLPTIRTAAQLAIFMQSLFALQTRFGGVLSRVGFGDKGPHLLLFWGAPAAFENDVQRALHFILDLQAQTAIPITCGITYRLAHTGFIGSVYAEDYAPFGGGVNLAARFISQAARGEIWLDEFVAARAGSRFELESAGEMGFKGFSAKQKVYILGERKEEDALDQKGAWLGREGELQAMREFAEPIFASKGVGALLLWGEPGIGKSSLAREFVQRCQLRDPQIVCFSAQCDEILRQPLNPFRYWLRRYLQVSESHVETRNKRSFNRAIDHLIAATTDPQLADELDRTRSFLGALVDLTWPDSLYEQMDAKGRYENTFAAITALLRAESQVRPLIFLLEDGHWLDDDSRDFLPRLLRSLASVANEGGGVLFCVTARPMDTDFNLGGTIQQAFHLDRLSRADLAGLAETALGGVIGADLLDLLDQRSEGNPYFAEQILAFLGEQGLLEHGSAAWGLRARGEIDLPSNVGSLLLARLDRLRPEVKEVVQTAAVLGREFESHILVVMLSGGVRLGECIEQAADEKIWHKLGERRYIFEHGLLRDAAYQMQTVQRRRGLHRGAYKALRSLYGAEAGEHFAAYAFHAGQAGMWAEAVDYNERAGWAALDVYQNRLADEHFSTALDTLSQHAAQLSLPPGLRFDLLLGRVTATERSGQLERRRQDLAQLEALAELMQDTQRTAEMLLRMAKYYLLTGAYKEAEHAAQRVLELGVDVRSMDAFNCLAQVDNRTGKLGRSIARARAGIALAEKNGDRRAAGGLFNLIGLVMTEQHDLPGALQAFQHSLAIAQETGRFVDEAPALNNLGRVAGMIGQYLEATAYYERALLIAQKTGDRQHEGIVLGNLGWLAGVLGAYERAVDYGLRFLRIAREVGDINGEAYGLINLSSFALARQDFAGARAYADHARELTGKTGDRPGEAWAWTYLGHSALEAGEVSAAAEAYQQALALRSVLQQAVLAVEPLGGLALAALRAGRPHEAIEYAEHVLPHLAAGNLDGTEEPLRVFLNVYHVLHALGDARGQDVLMGGAAFLRKRAAAIQDEQARQMFLSQVPAHRELLVLAEQASAAQ
jgi:class 3 adenylate cyclase/tetratricopeptide (TPR) repeat protein